jgi:hypothetical protein
MLLLTEIVKISLQTPLKWVDIKKLKNCTIYKICFWETIPLKLRKAPTNCNDNAQDVHEGEEPEIKHKGVDKVGSSWTAIYVNRQVLE